MTQSTAARKDDHIAWTGRVEDDALLRGHGRFGDDVKPDGALCRVFRAIAACLRENRAHRYRGREIRAGCGCGADRRPILRPRIIIPFRTGIRFPAAAAR